MEQKYKKLPTIFKKNGYYYRVLDRTETTAIVEQCVAERADPFCYEVFYIKKQDEMDVNIGGVDVHYEAKENPPSNEDFGKTAWSIRDRDKALKLFKQL